MRRLGGILGSVLLLAACVSQTAAPLPKAPIPYSTTIAVQAQAVPLDPTDLTRTAVDGFRYAGGIALTSDQTSRLHGLSELKFAPDGRAVMVSDVSDLWTARLVLDAAGRLTGWTEVSSRALKGPDGLPFPSSDFWDAESLTLLKDGSLLVGFEQTHRVWRYPSVDGDGLPVPAPKPDEAMADNDGMEGLAAWGDGYWVGVEPGDIWFCRLKAACEQVTGLPTPPVGMRLSSLTAGPNGELVILHHVYIPGLNASKIRVSIVRDPQGVKTVVGQFALSTPASVDNFEGVAVQKKPNGDWRLYLLSDDNFRSSQRTLMLAFDWTPPK